LPAYRKAIALKVDFIEIDVRATKDVLWYGPIPFVAVMQQLQRRYPNCILMPDPLTEQGIPYIVKRLHPKVIAAV
jgi:hypothetical protein